MILGPEGDFLDADQDALELLGAVSVDELRATHPDRFAPISSDAGVHVAWQRPCIHPAADGLLAEGAFRRLDGELVRVRTAIDGRPDGTYRALLYAVERPTTNVMPRLCRIADILAEWRSAERQLLQADPRGEDAARLAEEIELLRDQHRLIFDRSVGART